MEPPYDPSTDDNYHLCALPGPQHVHYIPRVFETCYDKGCVIWNWK
jgi:hypothetical protein